MYHFHCIFFIIIIPSFVVLLNCLYLNPRVLLFVPSPPHPVAGGRAASERLCDPSCWRVAVWCLAAGL